MEIGSVIGNYQIFLGKIFKDLESTRIDINDLIELDHMAYRVTSYQKYNDVKNKLEKFGEKISENIIRGRPIANFKLFKPLNYKSFSISCIELPAPAEGDQFKEGLEHVEFVTKITLQKFLEKYKSLPFDIKGLAKDTNQDITLKFNNFVIKFHEKSIIAVIESEK